MAQRRGAELGSRGRRHSVRRITVPVACVIALVALVGSVMPVTARDSRPAKPHRMAVQAETAEAASTTSTDLCPAAAPDPVPDGQPIVVELPPAAPFTVGEIPATVWRRPWVSDPAWRLWFESLRWLSPLARRAAEDGQMSSLSVIVAQAAAFQTQNPDPGTSLYGWDEGTAQRRLQALNCLYALTRSTSLVASMKACANVQLGPRYYGPPRFPVHNHGLMANMRLTRASDLLAIPAWRTTAVNRMAYEAPRAFSALGTVWEQSSEYQKMVLKLWDEARATIGPGRTSDLIRANVRRASGVFRWLTEPGGRIVQIGDASRIWGWTGSGTTRVFRDDPAGYVVGRWSWTDRNTTYYTLRYGPPRRAHGHDDRPSVTWSTRGVRVLVGPGIYTVDPGSPFYAWQRSARSHNAALVTTRSIDTTKSVRMSSWYLTSSAHTWTTYDTLYGYGHWRRTIVDHARKTFRVRDTYTSGVGLVRQYWHLDPTWSLYSKSSDGRALLFKHPSGLRLTVRTTGALSFVAKGLMDPLAGWQFPDYGQRSASYEIAFRTYTGAIETSFAIT